MVWSKERWGPIICRKCRHPTLWYWLDQGDVQRKAGPRTFLKRPCLNDDSMRRAEEQRLDDWVSNYQAEHSTKKGAHDWTREENLCTIYRCKRCQLLLLWTPKYKPHLDCGSTDRPGRTQADDWLRRGFSTEQQTALLRGQPPNPELLRGR